MHKILNKICVLEISKIPLKKVLNEYTFTYPLRIEMWARILAITIIVDVKTMFAIF